MADEGAAHKVWRLGGAEYDRVSKSLRVEGRVTLLNPQASEVFARLAERVGERVSKEELLAAAWPGRIVHENSVAKVISSLRAAIRGSGLAITASYGMGYILHERQPAQVQAQAASGLEPDLPAAAGRPRRRLGVAALAAVCVAGLAGGAAFVLHREANGHMPFRGAPPETNDRPDAIGTVLWVDDHPANNQLEVAAFRQQGVAVHLAESTDDALKLLAMNRYHLVISDLGRGDDRLAGLKMIGEMKRRQIAVPVVIYTLRPPTPAKQAAQRALVRDGGADDLAVTPQEVRAKVMARLTPHA